MNFFPATMTDVGVRLPFGEVTLTQEVHDLLARHQTPNNVIVGIRPEHLEDASVMDGYARIRALTFDVTVDFVESLGADKYCISRAKGQAHRPPSLRSWPANRGSAKTSSWQGFPPSLKPSRVTRFSWPTLELTASSVRHRSKLTIFDADTGKNLTLRRSRRLPPA